MRKAAKKEKRGFWQDKRVLVTGGGGFFGSHLVGYLNRLGVSKIFVPRRKDYDLRRRQNAKKVVKGADIVIHLAGTVGGIGFNRENPATMFYDNILIGVHLIEEAHRAGVKKFVNIGTVCSYPKYAEVPFREEQLWTGYPEETNAPYGIAKLALMVQGNAYRVQHGFNHIFLIPVNLYGPGDKFDPAQSHVIPALIKKVFDARKRGDKHIVVWGTGKPTREFLYVEDAAEGVVLAAERYDKADPVNLGAHFEISIKDLAELICELSGFDGKIVWDKTRPDGQPRRKLDVSRAEKEFGFRAKTDFRTGLKKTIDWYARERKAGRIV